MALPRWNKRLKLKGGSNVHAAERPLGGRPTDLVTPCGYGNWNGETERDDSEQITCRHCKRLTGGN